MIALLTENQRAGGIESRPTWTNQKLARRIPELDGIRGLAILLVVILHYVVMTVNVSTGWQLKLMVLFRLYCNGVDLFFVLSGFLIGGILLDTKCGDGYFRTFYSRRFHRIVPLYAVLIATFAIGGYYFGTNGEIFNHRVPFWSYPIFIQNVFMTFNGYGSGWMSATWSLAVEEQFYLLLPFAVRRLSHKGIVIFAIGMIVVAPVIRAVIAHQGFNGCNLLPCRSDALGFGLLVAIACRNEMAWTWVVSHRRYIYGAFVLVGWAGFVCMIRGILLGLTWIATFNALILILVVANPGRAERLVFRSGVLSKLGTVAYSVYLFHGGIQLLYHYLLFGAHPSVHNWPTFWATLLSLATTLLLAAVSWRVLEKPLIKRASFRYQYGKAVIG